MIFIERTITIKRNQAKIKEPIVLYKGDRNIELQFTIENNPFKYKDDTEITYSQLAIKRPDAGPIFSDPVEILSDKVIFIVTGDMIDELEEIGDYDFQIQLLNGDQSSRGSLPPVYGGIDIRDPLCEQAMINTAAVNSRSTFVMRADNDNDDLFDNDGNYNRTTWVSGDIITDARLNKVEEALYQINNSVPTDYATVKYVDESIVDVEHYVDSSINLEEKQLKEYMMRNYSSISYVDSAIRNSTDTTKRYVDNAIRNIEVPEADLTGYATENYVDAAIANVELMPGPQGEPGEQGPMGPQGPAGKDADPTDLTGYATEDYVNNLVGDIESLLGGI